MVSLNRFFPFRFLANFERKSVWQDVDSLSLFSVYKRELVDTVSPPFDTQRPTRFDKYFYSNPPIKSVALPVVFTFANHRQPSCENTAYTCSRVNTEYFCPYCQVDVANERIMSKIHGRDRVVSLIEIQLPEIQSPEFLKSDTCNF